MKRKLIVEAEGESIEEIKSEIAMKLEKIKDKLDKGFYTGKDWSLESEGQEKV